MSDRCMAKINWNHSNTNETSAESEANRKSVGVVEMKGKAAE